MASGGGGGGASGGGRHERKASFLGFPGSFGSLIGLGTPSNSAANPSISPLPENFVMQTPKNYAENALTPATSGDGVTKRRANVRDASGTPVTPLQLLKLNYTTGASSVALSDSDRCVEGIAFHATANRPPVLAI